MNRRRFVAGTAASFALAGLASRAADAVDVDPGHDVGDRDQGDRVQHEPDQEAHAAPFAAHRGTSAAPRGTSPQEVQA